jgi:hypothetical protein
MALVALAVGCESYFFLPGTGGGGVLGGGASIFTGEPFTDQLILGRTFFNGKAVTTTTFRVNDPTREAFGIDFNGDGKIDPVAAYALGPDPIGGVIQILLSQGPAGTVDFISLTLDGNNSWNNIADVAVADIDNDGAPDIIAATADGVVYLRNPGPGRTTSLREWGAESADLEFLSGSTANLTVEELNAIIVSLLPAGTSLLDYQVAIEQGYFQVEIADMNRDQQNDVVASQRLKIELQPRGDSPLPAVSSITGAIQIFLNPGNALDGQGWQLVQVGQHERIQDLDRQGASSLLANDMDGDGDLDVVSAARDDDNVQVAWFENPGLAGFFDPALWTQWRIGSIHDALAIDVADLTGDGRPDVVATGGAQMQLVLFEQPETGARRDFDWDAFPIVTFGNYEPRDVRILDVDNDGSLEIVVGGTAGAVRYFESPANPRNPWTAVRIHDFGESGGEVGFVGYGDLDADGDFDLVTVVDGEDANGDNVTWIRNEVIR